MTESNNSRPFLMEPTKPRNVEQIVSAAQEYEYNAQVPVKYWLRTAAALLKEADIYMQEGDDETTYLLLFRHAHLVLAHLVSHPDAKDKSSKTLLAQAEREVNQNLKTLDDLKPRINQRYERFSALLKEREERRTAQSKPVTDDYKKTEIRKQSNKRKVQQLHGYENSDLAVQLAQEEFHRRAAAREITTSQSRRVDDGEDLSKRLQAVRARVDFGDKRSNETSTSERHGSDGSGYNYPSVKGRQTQGTPTNTSHPRPLPISIRHERSIPPSLPPKPFETRLDHIPPRPEKVRDVGVAGTTTSKPSADTTYTFAPTASLENGNPLRTLFLPPTLRTTFLRLAHENTKANLETCGFLAGTLISNALFVSKLIIPAQISTSDTCEMTNESQLFDYVDSGADLMILGWIHTHPSQTCFMSSRDLHTHAGYQMMLPESVAIVCAPSKGDTSHGGDWGVYRLTDPPGKMAILNCTRPGIFHPHDVENIYTDALRPGHVVEAKGLDFEVVDLRKT